MNQPAPADAAALAAALDDARALIAETNSPEGWASLDESFAAIEGAGGDIGPGNRAFVALRQVLAALPVHPPAPPEPGAIARFLDKYGLTNTSGARHEARRAALAAARAALAPDSQTEALLAALAARGVYTPGDLEAMLVAAPPAPPDDDHHWDGTECPICRYVQRHLAPPAPLPLDAIATAYTTGYRAGLSNEVDDWNASDETLVGYGRHYAAGLATPEPAEDGQP